MPAHKKYPDELREQAVQMVLELRRRTGRRRALQQVGEQLGVHPQTLRYWVNAADAGAALRGSSAPALASGRREQPDLPLGHQRAERQPDVVRDAPQAPRSLSPRSSSGPGSTRR